MKMHQGLLDPDTVQTFVVSRRDNSDLESACQYDLDDLNGRGTEKEKRGGVGMDGSDPKKL